MPSSSFQDTPVTSWCMKRQRLVDCDSDTDCPVPIDDIETDRQVVTENKNLKPGKRFQKTDDDAVPLPDPFPLPKNYKTDVNVALMTGKMTRETKKRFFPAVAAVMFTYKRYPNAEDYQNVARCVVSKYPFFRSPVGSPRVSSMICYFNHS